MKKFFIAALCMAATLQLSAQNPLKDWANFQRYQQANQAIDYPVKAVFMGNSITDGWAATDPDFFSENQYVGRGIGGQVSAQMVMRFRQDVINLKPEAVVILAGTNDIAMNPYAVTLQQTFYNIKTMVDLARANKIKVVLCSTMPAYEFGWNKSLKPAEDIKGLNVLVKSYAEENNIPYVDYHSAMKDKRDGLPAKYSQDGVHPTLKGYKVMEKLVQRALKKVLK